MIGVVRLVKVMIRIDVFHICSCKCHFRHIILILENTHPVIQGNTVTTYAFTIEINTSYSIPIYFCIANPITQFRSRTQRTIIDQKFQSVRNIIIVFSYRHFVCCMNLTTTIIFRPNLSERVINKRCLATNQISCHK